MKSLLNRIVGLTTVCLALGSVRPANGQGTAFTYQGSLTSNGSAASGNYGLKFSVYDDSVAGTQLGESVTNSPTTVSNGLFLPIGEELDKFSKRCDKSRNYSCHV